MPVMLPRSYAPDLDPAADQVVLSAEESHHLTRVLRLGTGDPVAVFDGRGHEFLGRLAAADPRAARVRLVDPIAPVPEFPVRVTLVQAVLKGDAMDDVVRDATMAGISHIAPVVSARTLVKVNALKRAHAADRWRRIAVASAKQCRRAWVPEIDLARPLAEWLATGFEGARLLLVEPAAAGQGSVKTMRDLQAQQRPVAAACLVGPEGGWTAEEREAAATAGCIPVTLGTMTFRADAAALVAMGALTVVWGE